MTAASIPAQATCDSIVDQLETNPNNKHVLGSLCMAHKSEPEPGS